MQSWAELVDQKFVQCVPCETHVAALEKSVRRRIFHVAVTGFGGIKVKGELLGLEKLDPLSISNNTGLRVQSSKETWNWSNCNLALESLGWHLRGTRKCVLVLHG